jgi:hypothetical protein
MPTHCISLHRFSEVIQIYSNALHFLAYFQGHWTNLACPTLPNHVQAVGSVRLPSEICETQAAGLPESVGGKTVRICSHEQMSNPHELVDVPDEHVPAGDCWKYLLTRSADSQQGPTDMSSFRETCTTGAQTLLNWHFPGPRPPTDPPPAATGPRPPTDPPPAATRQASSSSTVPPDTLLQQSSAPHCREPPVKVQKLDPQASAPLPPPSTPPPVPDQPAEEVPARVKSEFGASGDVAKEEEDIALATAVALVWPPDANAQGASTSSVQARSPTTPRGAPVTPPGLIDGSPSSAEMTCPTTVARVASEHDAKSAKLYSPENWKDHINFRRSIITRI